MSSVVVQDFDIEHIQQVLEDYLQEVHSCISRKEVQVPTRIMVGKLVNLVYDHEYSVHIQKQPKLIPNHYEEVKDDQQLKRQVEYLIQKLKHETSKKEEKLDLKAIQMAKARFQISSSLKLLQDDEDIDTLVAPALEKITEKI